MNRASSSHARGRGSARRNRNQPFSVAFTPLKKNPISATASVIRRVRPLRSRKG